MQKNTKVTLVFIALLLIITIYTVIKTNIVLNKFKKELSSIEIGKIDFTQLKDGNYNGECILSLVTAKVNVTVKEGKISEIKILEHKHGPSKKYSAEPLINKIIEKQSIEVDTITGATASSKVMIKAIEEALKKGL